MCVVKTNAFRYSRQVILLITWIVILNFLGCTMSERMASTHTFKINPETGLAEPYKRPTKEEMQKAKEERERLASVKHTFPDSMEEFGFKFNEDGELRNTETNEQFNYRERPEDNYYNQARYEALGELITPYIYTLLEKEGLERLSCPMNRYSPSAKKDEPKSFIYATREACVTTGKLLMLIHGDGVVRAGQWSRRLIMNDNLDKGTQLPYIKRAIKDGWEVMVFNTNLNHIKKEGQKIPIRENDTPENHMMYVWDHYMRVAGARRIAIVAHSYGGVVAVNTAKKHTKDFEKKVFAVAFTDSIHTLQGQECSRSLARYFRKVGRNFVSSDKPLGTELEYPHLKDDVSRFSAGTKNHESTSYVAMDDVFKFIQERYEQTVKDEL